MERGFLVIVRFVEMTCLTAFPLLAGFTALLISSVVISLANKSPSHQLPAFLSSCPLISFTLAPVACSPMFSNRNFIWSSSVFSLLPFLVSSKISPCLPNPTLPYYPLGPTTTNAFLIPTLYQWPMLLNPPHPPPPPPSPLFLCSSTTPLSFSESILNPFPISDHLLPNITLLSPLFLFYQTVQFPPNLYIFFVFI